MQGLVAGSDIELVEEAVSLDVSNVLSGFGNDSSQLARQHTVGGNKGDTHGIFGG